MAKYTVAVAGATGYAGGEALRILAAHPDFDITCVAGHSSVGESMAKHMPHIPQLANLVVEDIYALLLFSVCALQLLLIYKIINQ